MVIIQIIFFAFLVYFIYSQYINYSRLEKLIIKYFELKGFKVENIRNLSIAERARYKQFGLLSKYLIISSFLMNSNKYNKYFKVIETTNSQGIETQKFIEVEIQNNKIENINIIDSYEI